MKTLIKPLVLSVAALLGLALNASAQDATMGSDASTSGSSYGLLGQDYAGAFFSYTHFDDGPPSAARTYGLIANRPTEIANLDASFKYEYSRMSAFGMRARQHDVAIGATKYIPLAAAKPFISGDIGWAFAKAGGVKDNSFFYVVTGGAEFQVLPRLAVSPYVSYSEAKDFHVRGWDFGVKAAYRLSQDWSAMARVQFDDDYVDYRVGANRHF
jgi:hypothetical protein